jgi:hypothetical protein
VEAYRSFNQETKDGSDMLKYSKLLGESISSIIEVKEESDIDSFLGGGQISFFESDIKGLDDFELVCFLVVRDVDVKVKKDFRIVVAGGRDFADYKKLCSEIDDFLRNKIGTHNITIISGHANGADKLGERYAREHGMNLELCPAEWERYGSAAGPIRNKRMSERADAVIAFWNGKSQGTKNMIDCAIQENLPYKIIEI